MLVVHSGTDRRLMRKPTHWKRIWNDQGSRANQDYDIKKIPAHRNDSYKALEVICNFRNRGHSEPPRSLLDKLALIYESCLTRADYGGEVWSDSGTGAKHDVALKSVNGMGTMWPSHSTYYSPGPPYKINQSRMRT